MLKERGEWQSKAYRLESKLNALSTDSLDYPKTNECFIFELGEIIRPMVHDMKGQLSLAGTVAKKVSQSIGQEESTIDINELMSDMELINDSLSYIHRLISNLSYLGGKIPDNFTSVNLNKLIKDTTEFIKRKHNDFITELDIADEPLQVMAHEDSLTMLITNLVKNAIEACDPKHGQIYISAKRDDSNAELVNIIVKDNGIGIHENEKERMYDIHYTTKKNGFGLGLYLVKKAVELHKGIITCEGEPFKGTSFTVSLPIEKEEKNDNS
ncbi:MAG: HAMP domain-containing sensor histidine kinase [Candidatus Magnetobacterium sp. LHC-1]